ncbi:hypothetical protein OAT00_03880 [Pelagibacteraceae bacterium]|nr:hypothetical protein [Pelagibacteraceae bacterium]
MKFKIKIPKKKIKEKEIKDFFLAKKMNLLIENSLIKRNVKDERVQKEPHLPILKDLYFLYKLITLNKRTTILEYGSGWSTLVMHKALIENKNKYHPMPFPRCSWPYGLIAVENNKKFLRITEKRLKLNKCDAKLIRLFFSEAEITIYNNRYATHYKKNPRCNPDLIYIDGPSQWGVTNSIENFTTENFAMMPMLCQVLKFEHFLTPGTIIVFDGRAANARFLKCNFQRNWKYINNKSTDHHIFFLDEEPLGPLNYKQIKFYNSSK